MYKKLLVVATMILFSGVFATAQEIHGTCGTVGEWAEIVAQRTLKNKIAIRQGLVPQGRDIEYVPIRFHLVAATNGTGRVKEARVLDQLCALNNDYAPIEIQFYFKKGADGSLFNYIDNSTVFNTPGSPAARLLMNSQRDNGAINIFIVQNATAAGNNDVQTLGYFDPNSDWIVMIKDDVSLGETTLPHEVGHFFDLAHPHNGWDAIPYDPDIHGIPAPAFSPGGVPTERQNGSNCETAGDFLCDTAPDYNFGLGWPNCNYTGGALDPLGDLVDPDEVLFMGYFLNGCARGDYYFSEEQMDIVNASLFSSERAYVRPGITPSLAVIDEAPTLIEPDVGETVPGYNEVWIDWSSVNGAEYYWLEIDNLPSFNTSNLQTYLVTSSTIPLELEPSKPYFWRVYAFTTYSTCGGVSATGSFLTDNTVATKDIAGLSNWTAFPNPTSGNQNVSVSLQAEQAFEANVQLLSVDGKQVQNIGTRLIEAGENFFQIGVGDLAEGVYILSLVSEAGVSNKRIVVSK